jgi:hypothetical protein
MCAFDRWFRVAAWLVALCCCLPAFGQQAGTREQEVIRRLRLQVQQLQQEQSAQQTALQQANAQRLESARQLQTAQVGLQRLRAAAAAQAGSATLAQQDLQALRDERTALQARLDAQGAALALANQDRQQLRGAQAELQRALQAQQAQRLTLETHGLSLAQGLQDCSANNKALHTLGQELLQRYADKGVGQVLWQAEPFLQFKRVALENLKQDYQDKLDQSLFRAAPVPAGNVPAEPVRAP